MALALRRTGLAPPIYSHHQDYAVIDGGREVGRIYGDRTPAAADAAWFWSIIVIGARHAGIKTDGRAATFGRLVRLTALQPLIFLASRVAYHRADPHRVSEMVPGSKRLPGCGSIVVVIGGKAENFCHSEPTPSRPRPLVQRPAKACFRDAV